MPASPRRQVLSLCAGYAVAGLFWGSLAASLPALQAQSGLSDGNFGLAFGLMALSAFPVMRVFGARLGQIEPWAIPGCLAAFAIGATVLALWPDRSGLLLGFVITGGASGALDIALNNRTARVEVAAKTALFNRVHALFPAAMLAASAATGLLRDLSVPLAVIFLVVAAGFLAVSVFEYGSGRHIEPTNSDSSGARRPRLPAALLLLAAIAALGAFQESATSGWAAIFVESVRGGTPLQAGLAAAAFTLGLSAGRLGAHAADSVLRPVTTVRLAALIALPGFLIIAAHAPLPLTIAACFVAGAGVGPIEPAVFRAAATRTDAAARGPALASVTAIAYLGYLLSPPILGLVAEHIGWPALWGAAALCAITVAVATTRIPRNVG